MDKVDITIIGAGVVGLAIAARISDKRKSVVVLERNWKFGQETSSRNSEVIHSGIYYRPGSMKGALCLEGNERMYRLCKEQNIKHRKIEKIIVAFNKDEIQKLEQLYENGKTIGVKGMVLLKENEARQLEPNLNVPAAILCPSTGIVDSHALMEFFRFRAEEKGVVISFASEATGIEKMAGGYTVLVRDSDGKEFSFFSQAVINAAGLDADKVAHMAGIDIKKEGYELQYVKGEYFQVDDKYRGVFNRLIYPLPEKNGLGIHTVVDIEKRLRLGPNAFNVDKIEYSVKENHKQEFLNFIKKLIPSINMQELEPDMSGIRPQITPDKDGFRDFIINHEKEKGLPLFINLIGIESPGLTASPAIGEYVVKLLS